MTLRYQLQASAYVQEGEHLKLFKDADADIGNLLAAAPPPQALVAPGSYDHGNLAPLGMHPFGLQPWSMAAPAPNAIPYASTVPALHTALVSDEVGHPGSSLFMPSNHQISPSTLPMQHSGDAFAAEGGQGEDSEAMACRACQHDSAAAVRNITP